MPFRDELGEQEADIFFMAYTLGTQKGDLSRPLTICYNGGPGSSSVWLHLGGLAPQRVVLEEEGWMPQPPYHLVDNDFTWFDRSDLLFLDPVGTGLLLKPAKGVTWLDVAYVSGVTALGIVALGIAAQHWRIKRNSIIETGLFAIAGLMLTFARLIG